MRRSIGGSNGDGNVLAAPTLRGALPRGSERLLARLTAAPDELEGDMIGPGHAESGTGRRSEGDQRSEEHEASEQTRESGHQHAPDCRAGGPAASSRLDICRLEWAPLCPFCARTMRQAARLRVSIGVISNRQSVGSFALCSMMQDGSSPGLAYLFQWGAESPRIAEATDRPVCCHSVHGRPPGVPVLARRTGITTSFFGSCLHCLSGVQTA